MKDRRVTSRLAFARGAASAMAAASVLFGANGPAAARAADGPPSPAVAELLEDNAATLLPQLTNPTGDPGEGHVERDDVFSGDSAVRIVPVQRFEPRIPGWNYRVRERPGREEYRYVRWAWRSDGCVGTMVQFHIETGWSVRYLAGQNPPGWGAKTVADAPPARWTVVTRDLFADFGECTVTGIAFTAFNGRAGRFDHVYFGRTPDDLDRTNATGIVPGGPIPLDAARLERLWGQLCGDDAPKAYRARWALAADPERAAPFLRRAVETLPTPADLPARIRQWVTDLGADESRVRDAAAEHLARHADAADEWLRTAAAGDSPEVRGRAAGVLRAKAQRGPWPDPAAEAVRTLRLMDSAPAARLALSALAAKGVAGTTPADLAGTPGEKP